MSILGKIFGDANARYVKSLQVWVDEINVLEKDYEKMSDHELRALTPKFKERLKNGEPLDDILAEAFAAVREASRRVLGQRHFDVQLIGGIVLHQGKIAEMKTGEGKTLVATLPLYLNSLTGRGVHLVTPNDYLSRVGAGWMGAVYHALGVSTGVVTHDTSGIYDPDYQDPAPHGDPRLSHFRAVRRHEAYFADITYGTNNEFGFDYLRDNLEYQPNQLRQSRRTGRDSDPASEPGHNFAIIDEVDSILIDEARTPLIISAPDQESGELYKTFSKIVPQLKENEDYNVDEKMRAVTLMEAGIDRVEKILNIENIYAEKGVKFVHHLEQALRAQALYQRDRDYVVKSGEVIIVDEFTGRLMPGRRWSEGLHQAIEAKEGVQIQKESRTLATITFQNYFRMYRKLSGMTGTAQTSAEEFHKVYDLDVITIPTHRPMIREDKPDLVFRTGNGKLRALAREIKTRHEKGQPVLVGTVSIEKNERLSKMLEVEGVRHEVLNAKNHEREALIIAQAGRKGAVTVATNMAGRGVDILLGGTAVEGSGVGAPDPKEAEEVRALGGLHVIGTERHEARRIDNQLRGRSGRQGDPGSSQFFVSLEDDLMRVFGSDRIKSMMETLGIPEDEPIVNKMVSRALEAAQGKIEGFHFDTRKHVLEFDDVLNKQRDSIYRMRHEILFAQESRIKNQESSTIVDSADLEQEPRSLKEQILEIFADEITRIVEFHTSIESEAEWNLEEIFETVKAMAGVPDEVHASLREIASRESEDKRADMVAYLIGVITDSYNAREQAIGEEAARNVERAVMLRAIDMLWVEHLDQMEHLRDSVRLRAYGQRDPLVEYKNEGSRLYHELQQAIRAQIVNTIFKVGGSAPEPDRPRNIEERRPEIFSRHSEQSEESRRSQQAIAVRTTPEIGRNDPCPCGSGKKYKKCHGQ